MKINYDGIQYFDKKKVDIFGKSVLDVLSQVVGTLCYSSHRLLIEGNIKIALNTKS